ncbi:hypothetical protein [Nocardia sp. GAS34]|uniref:hypothetical protein n=1 Tax=unclassified Nocardia TaxID=2637762 RepID=UPI003D191E32
MMSGLGHEVFLCASQENEAACAELITIVDKQEQREWFGSNDFFAGPINITWGKNDRHWQVTNRRAIEEISRRAQPRDFVCIIGAPARRPSVRPSPT